jgi:flagellar biogenesis protein FliO
MVPTDLVAYEPGPTLLGATLRMGIALLATAAAAWVLLRWRRKVGAAGRRLEVVERAFLARGASIALIKVEGHRLLVGFSSDGVRLLRDLDSGPVASRNPAFGEVLRAVSQPREAAR